MNGSDLASRIREELNELDLLNDEVASQIFLIEKLETPEYRQKIRDFLADKDELVRRLQSPDNQIRREIENIAGKLSGYYTGVERILSPVVRYIDGEVLTGGSSHKRLLDIVSEPTYKRGAVISFSLKEELMQVKGFRNRERHNYPRTLKNNVVLGAAKLLPELHRRLNSEVAAFVELLPDDLGTQKNEKNEVLSEKYREQYKAYRTEVPPMPPSVGVSAKWENRLRIDIAIAKIILSENKDDPKQGENRVRQILSQSDRVLELTMGKDRSQVGSYISSIIGKAKS